VETIDGDESFDAFVQARATGLLRYGYALTGSRHDAADLVQEALARLGTAWPRVKRKGDPEGYVRVTMARLHVSWWRHRRRERLVERVPERADTDPALDGVQAESGLWQALATLPPRQRAVLVLRYYEHCPDEEIAAVLGIARGTVRSTALRGLEKLRAAWAPGAAAITRGPQ
jgi:RNA polymerase sigma-70 factor (sigma-E family)